MPLNKRRDELPWLYYPKANRVIINAHNFPSSWSPADITTQIWLDASDSSTLYDATSGGSLVAADGSIARWEDKSGNSRHFTQATSGRRPLRKTSVQNSLDVVRFDGTDDSMRLLTNLSGLMRNVGGASCFAVASFRSAPTTAKMIFYCSTGTGTGGNGRFAMSGGTGTSNRLTGFGRRDDAQASASITTGGTTAGTSFRNYGFTGDYTNSNGEVFIGGVSDGTNASWTTDGSTSNTDPVCASIGSLVVAADTQTAIGDLDLCELIVTHAVESSGTIAQISSYFASKWGVA